MQNPGSASIHRNHDKKQHLVKLMCNFVAYTFGTILSTQFWVNCRCMYRKQTPKFVEQPDCTAQCAIVMVVSSYRGSIFPWRTRIGQRLLCTSGFHFCTLKNDKKNDIDLGHVFQLARLKIHTQTCVFTKPLTTTIWPQPGCDVVLGGFKASRRCTLKHLCRNSFLAFGSVRFAPLRRW